MVLLRRVAILAVLLAALWGNLFSSGNLFSAGGAFAASTEDRVMKQWTRSETRSEKGGFQNVDIRVTYYSAEYIEALVRSESEKNLWTQDEEERYKYNLLKTLNLDECIAFHVAFDVTGTPVYLQPFDKHLKLYVGKTSVTPTDYDKRFNFRLQGKRDGMVWFPRYDAKGKNMLDGVKELRLVLDSAISQATTSGGDMFFIWNITGDDPSVLYKGTTAARLELDRLIKRLDKLRTDRDALQSQLDEIDKELGEINARVDVLQRQ
ncbi:MAG: hypothetical protein LBR38_07915 [Synergistaceae bacterium]|jgi:hypothetical protein|nr:hypothetical protein [Synergistaceae bacterium]